MSRERSRRRRADRGMTMLVVLVLMTVTLLGGLALARMTEIGTLASGNAAFREASLQASEVGANTAFAAVPLNIIATDLRVARVSAPATANFGQTVSVEFVITNAGTAAAVVPRAISPRRRGSTLFSASPAA